MCPKLLSVEHAVEMEEKQESLHICVPVLLLPPNSQT